MRQVDKYDPTLEWESSVLEDEQGRWPRLITLSILVVVCFLLWLGIIHWCRLLWDAITS